jgi:hypothetical protein
VHVKSELSLFDKSVSGRVPRPVRAHARTRRRQRPRTGEPVTTLLLRLSHHAPLLL